MPADFHAERLQGETWCYDIESSYPYVLAMRNYPSGKEHPIGAQWKTLEDIESIYRRCAYVIKVRLKGVKVDIREPVPYLSLAKCWTKGNYALDNGRILESEELVTTVTDVDLRIIKKQYRIEESEILGGYYWKYGPLPQAYRDLVQEYYRRKTKLKGTSSELEYMHYKGMVNSLYGVSAESPVKRSDIWTEHGWQEDKTPEETLYALNQFRPALPYNVGVWCTAYARESLEEMKNLAGYRDFLYCDTDSVFTLHPLDLKKFNARRILENVNHNVNATDTKGEMHYLGYAALDKHARQFATLGAKKYAYIDYDTGKFKITIAGVPKVRGAAELERAGGLIRFVQSASAPYIFRDTGKLMLTYNDDVFPHEENIDGHRVELTPNIVMSPCEYRLSTTPDYDELCNNPDVLKIIYEILKARELNHDY